MQWSTAIEVSAAVFGLLSVVLTVRRSIWCWPTGIVMVLLYAWVFWSARLYANMGLQGYFLVLSCYGWWYWLRGGASGGPARIRRAGRAELMALTTLALGGGLLGGQLLARHLQASEPTLDATMTCFSLVAQYLLSRKDLTAWWFWIVVDLLAIILFASQALWATTLLYVVFLALAVQGAQVWWRAARAEPGA
jgi:nicotinamide mononucleotide transporter